MNCPYCLNHLISFPKNLYECQYCPGEPTMGFDQKEIPLYFKMTVELKNNWYVLHYDILPQQLQIFKSDGIFPPNYQLILQLSCPHNSPRKIHQELKRIISLKAFL